MRYRVLHRWDLSPKEAIRAQKRIRELSAFKRFSAKKIRLIAGVDVSVKNDRSKAAIVILTYPGLEKKEIVTASEKTRFPYVPGLLTFREGPVILKCIEKLTLEPDLFIFDGQGLAHPRKTGLATHMGVILDRPSIGSAKSHLYGTYRDPGNKKGDFSLVEDKDGNPIGAVLRTRDKTNPVFVSPGHLTDIGSSIKIILACSPKYKIPEPIRAAHNAALQV
ncbi:MAG: endonuclease V [Candidatus Omnitrophota bacterium]|jgi:deoxyribonuclease V